MTRQLITYQVPLINDNHPWIGNLQLDFLFLVDQSYIATDIRTGFPYLLEAHRQTIKTIAYGSLEQFYQIENIDSQRPFEKLDGYLNLLEENIEKYLAEDSRMVLESISVGLYADIYQRQSSKMKDKRI